MKKRTGIFLTIGLLILIAIFSTYVLDMNQMQKGEEVFFSTWGYKYAPVRKEEPNPSSKVQNTEKIIYNQNDDYMDLLIPTDWLYEIQAEVSEYYRGGVRVYSKNSEQYANIYFADLFGVCGTGLEIKNDTLNDGTELTIGYYDGSDNWTYAVFEKNDKKVVGWNYGLKGEEAEEVLEMIKSINLNLSQE